MRILEDVSPLTERAKVLDAAVSQCIERSKNQSTADIRTGRAMLKWASRKPKSEIDGKPLAPLPWSTHRTHRATATTGSRHVVTVASPRRDRATCRPREHRATSSASRRGPPSDDGSGEPARPGNRANVVTSSEQISDLLEDQASKGGRREIKVTCGTCFSTKRGAHAVLLGHGGWWANHSCLPAFVEPIRIEIAWTDCDACGWRNYIQPPNGVPTWHAAGDCGKCGAHLQAVTA